MSLYFLFIHFKSHLFRTRTTSQMFTRFYKQYIDKGSACFKTETMREHNLNFAFRWFSPEPKSATTWDGE